MDHFGQRRHRVDSGMGLREVVVQVGLYLNFFVTDPGEGGTRADGFSEKFAARDGIECGMTPPD